jgi:transcription initiation factor TFIIB
MNLNVDEELWDTLIDSFNSQQKNINTDIKCKCGSYNIIKDESMYICLNCSNILDIVMDSTAEWRYYGSDDNKYSDPSRCGLPTNTLLPKSSLGSVVGGFGKESRDLQCVRRLQVWNSMPYYERKLLSVFDKLTSNTQNKGIPTKVLHDAKILYKEASVKKISRGDNNEGLIASCLYHACIINNVPRSPKEIAEMSNISQVILTKGNVRFQKLMPINVECSAPKDYISRFGSQLNLSKNQINDCIKLSEFLEKEEIINDNSPTSSSAGIIYYYICYLNFNVSKKIIAKICGVSEVTITKCNKNLIKYKDVIDTFIKTNL